MLENDKLRYRSANAGIRSTIIGITANAALALIKGAAGFFGNSYALIADAIESTSDIFSSLIVWFGLRIAAKPPDKEHPYGHGKAEPLAAAIVSLALFGAAIIIIVQSLREIAAPHHAPEKFTLIVLIVVVLVKEALFRFVINVGEKNESTAVKTDAWHHRSDAITSAAVFVGILIAIIGGKGYESADDWAAMFASGIIFFNAYRLLRPAVAELMDESPSFEIVQNVRKIAGSVRGVKALDKCFIRKVGFGYYVDLHVVVDGKMSVERGHKVSHDVKDTIRSSDPRISNILVHLEPFRKDKGRSRSGFYKDFKP